MILGESNDDYHLAPQVSNSKLSTYLRRGAHAYEAMYVSRSYVRKPTAAMRKGSDFEDAVCGRAEVAVVPEGMKLSTKAGIAFKEENAGKLIVGAADAGLFTKGVDNVRALMDEKGFLTGAVEQPTFRADYPGLPGIQARPDWFVPSTGVAPDLKTTDRLDRFHFAIEDYLYFMQAAFVRRSSGISDLRHPLVVLEKKYPYPCEVFWLTDAYVRDGLDLMDRALEKLASHYKSGVWPLIERNEVSVSPPDRDRWFLHMGRQYEINSGDHDFSNI